MALVLVAVGLFVYARVGSDLDSALDTSLRTRADDLAATAAVAGRDPIEQVRPRLVESDESLSQVIGPDGRVEFGSPGLEDRPLLDGGELARARRGPLFVDRDSVSGFDESVRLLARPAEGRVVVVGATREDRAEALSSLGSVLLVGGPVALLLAALAAYGVATAALRPVGAMRREASEISRLGSGRRLPVAPGGDELAELGGTLNEMLDRLERLGRARARLRGEREPRAAHAARAAANRARARPARGPLTRGAARRARLGGRGERPARAARRGPPRAGAR